MRPKVGDDLRGVLERFVVLEDVAGFDAGFVVPTPHLGEEFFAFEPFFKELLGDGVCGHSSFLVMTCAVS